MTCSLVHSPRIRTSHPVIHPPNILSTPSNPPTTPLLHSQSKAGLSDPSNQLIAFTLCAWPDPPPSVEILKVTENGLLLSWLPPMRDNGMKGSSYPCQHNEVEQLSNLLTTIST